MIPPVPFRSPLAAENHLTIDWIRWLTGLRDAANGVQVPSKSDADAQPLEVYYSLTGSKLSFKDPSGVVHALY